MPSASFTTIAQPNPGGVLFIEIPEKVVRSLGEKQRAPVRVTLNGVRYRSTVAVYGGRYYLPARREIREAAKLAPGSAPGSRSKRTRSHGPSRFPATSRQR